MVVAQVLDCNRAARQLPSDDAWYLMTSSATVMQATRQHREPNGRLRRDRDRPNVPLVCAHIIDPGGQTLRKFVAPSQREASILQNGKLAPARFIDRGARLLATPAARSSGRSPLGQPTRLRPVSKD